MFLCISCSHFPYCTLRPNQPLWFSHPNNNTLTNFMEPSPSWEAISHSVTQEWPNTLWNPTLHYRVHKSLLPVSTLRQMNPLLTNHLISPRSISILFSELHLYLPSSLFSYDFPAETIHAFLFSHMPCSPYPPWLDDSNYIWRGVRVMKHPIKHISPASYNLKERKVYISRLTYSVPISARLP
jgi:hypothetical protein